MSDRSGRLSLRPKAPAGQPVFQAVPIESWRFALAKAEDVGEAKDNRNHARRQRRQEPGTDRDNREEEHGDAGSDAPDQIPEQISFETPRPTMGIGGGIGVRQSKFCSHCIGQRRCLLEVADIDAGVGVESKDLVEGEDDRGRRCDDGSADDRQFSNVGVPTPNREPAGDDCSDAEHETEQHDHCKTVADAGLQVCGREPTSGGLGQRIKCVECHDCGDEHCRAESGIKGKRQSGATAEGWKQLFHSFHIGSVLIFRQEHFAPEFRA